MSGQPMVNTTQTQQAQKSSVSTPLSKGTGSSQASRSTSGHASGSPTSKSPATWTGKKRPNRHSRGKNGKPTGKHSGTSKSGHQKNGGKPFRKPAARRGPAYEYVSSCCGVRALKPRCGAKVTVKDPETGKPKQESKGLGHWRCSGCRKYCSVKPQKPKETVNVTPTVGGNILPDSSVTPVAGVPAGQ